ncbi:MAG: hypothetical protein A3J29_19290 [Acidobacteria bacterium RIFCSPLOWO2_12_FULL_67_14b]|nr:MAG: hypothetical protein A3J29_19290 [Acidobacteria bacterium RIFCSPLOWO2_12_FULL_67_14b]
MNECGKGDSHTVVVTFLDMTVPPDRYPPAPVEQALSIVALRSPPLHYYRYLMDRVGRQWNWVDALRRPDSELAAYLAHPDRDLRVLHAEGIPAGFFELFSKPDFVEIAYFGLMPHMVGCGVGRWFLGEASRLAWAKGASRIGVKTCTGDDPAALALYREFGFRPFDWQVDRVIPLSPCERAKILYRTVD